MRKALVIGGTGVMGRAVLKGLFLNKVPTAFTYFNSQAIAEECERSFDQKGIRVDLRDPQALRNAIRNLAREDFRPDILIHCAAQGKGLALNEISEEDWQETVAVNCHSALIGSQEIVPGMVAQRSGDIVFVGGLDRTQSIPLPVHFATSQGALNALTMALSKELGSRGIRVNMVTSGLLEEGISRNFAPKLHEDYLKYSCLHRKGSPSEIAKVIVWFALKNQYISGKVIPVNGGI